MRCAVLIVDPQSPDAAFIARAAEILCAGRLVAFPTETVYGLGANALDPAAVARIFTAKGRPAGNPLIVHAPDIGSARMLVADWPSAAQQLAERFWPGPLTLVLPRQPIVPDAVTAGGSTVAVRVPAHPVALALLRACGLPLAAPSANRSTRLSPTRAEHVLDGLADRIDLLLDAGPTSGGIESTVLDLTVRPPRLLRPGMVAVADLETVVGRVTTLGPGPDEQPARSPGLHAKHYAPRTPLELVVGDGRLRVEELTRHGLHVGWVTSEPSATPSIVARIAMPDDPIGYAAQLYSVLHQLDAQGLDRIVLELPPATDAWMAVHDRLPRGNPSTASIVV